MGSASSSEPDIEPEIEPQLLSTISESDISKHQMIPPLNLITRLNDVGKQSLCKITVGDGEGIGFLCSVAVNEQIELQGMFTTNQLVSNSASSKELQVSFEYLNLKLYLKSEDVDYFFTCDFLNATFIQFKPAITEDLVTKGALFQNISSVPLPAGSHLYVVQHPVGGEAALLVGVLTSYWGFDLRHSANTEDSASGSPLMNSDHEVVAIHKGRCAGSSYSRATLMKYVVNAIKKDCVHFKGLPPRTPRQLQATDTKELVAWDLTSTDENKCLFVTKGFSKVFFRRTHHHWFWSPKQSNADESFPWMQISPQDPKIIVGGRGHGTTPQPRFCAIIDYLRRHGDFYCFQQKPIE